MQVHLILSVTCDDKPGVVESISRTIESANASWLESRLAHLSGKFVGVVQVRVNAASADTLKQGLSALNKDGIHIICEEIKEPANPGATLTANFSAIGPDRIGIVKEISSAFVRQSINVEELETTLSSMPYSGDPIFEARGQVSIPENLDIRSLRDRMDAIADELGLDIDIETNGVV